MTSYQVPRAVQGEGPERLRKWRVEHDLTQTALAARLGCSQATISEIEVGKIYPSEPVIAAAARRCGIAREAWGPRPERRKHVRSLTSPAAPRKGSRRPVTARSAER